MAATSIADQVSTLLGQSVAEPKVQGAPSPDVESAAIFTTLATNLVLNPRTLLYVVNLARNAILAAAQQELTQVALVQEDVNDTGNPSYTVSDTSSLTLAKTSLLQMQDQQKKVNSGSQTFQTFNNAVENFLQGQVSKNVKTPGATALTRPANEAYTDLPGDFAELVSLHADLLDRIYAIGVGVSNFISSPISTLIGLSTLSRASQDMQSIIDGIQADISGTSSRDYVQRLLTSRAALRVLGSAPVLSPIVVDTIEELPTGYDVDAESGPAAASVDTLTPVGGFGPMGVGTLSVQVQTPSGTTTITGDSTNIIQSPDSPAIVGASVVYPVTIQPIGPTGQQLFLKLTALASSTGWVLQPDGTYTNASYGANWLLESGLFVKTFRIPLNTTSSPLVMSLGSVITAINTAMSSPAQPSTFLIAEEFVQAGTNRLLLVATSSLFQTVAISLSSSEPSISSSSGVAIYTVSANAILGFGLHQTGQLNQLDSQRLTDAINIFFSSLLTASRNSDGSILLTTLATDPGLLLNFSGTWTTPLGLPAQVQAFSDQVILSGTVFGVQTNPINPSTIVDVSDLISLPTGDSTVTGASDTAITLASPLPTFPIGNVTITSSLYESWVNLSVEIQAEVNDWLLSPFASGLNSLNLAIAALANDSTPAKRNAATAIFTDLTTRLNSLVTDFSDTNTVIPAGGGTVEKGISDGIVNTLTERNYDKALDLYLRCKIVDMFQLDYQAASYAGSFMKAASAVAQNDLIFQNPAQDQGVGSTSFQDRKGTSS
jgi:hypothetical protein